MCACFKRNGYGPIEREEDSLFYTDAPGPPHDARGTAAPCVPASRRRGHAQLPAIPAGTQGRGDGHAGAGAGAGRRAITRRAR